MSAVAFSNTNHHRRRTPARHHKDSDELEVFEAARYFSCSAATDIAVVGVMREEKHGYRPQKSSLDVPVENIISHPLPKTEKLTDEKKSKQPSSPGGRLAGFLHSLFNSSSSKKRSKSLKDGEEGHGGRRRRSIISHSRSLRATTTTSSSSSSSFASASTKKYKGFCGEDLVSTDGVVERKSVLNNNGKHETHKVWANEMKGSSRKVEEEEEKEEEDSDSSSDLFELKNYDLGLPVYGSTDMEVIKRDATI